MNKISIYFIVLMLFSTSSIIGIAETQTSMIIQDVDEEENSFSIPVLILAFPRIIRPTKSVFLLVLLPNFLIDGFVHYDFDDGTFQDTGIFTKHVFMDSGNFKIEVSINTILGISAQGTKRIFVI